MSLRIPTSGRRIIKWSLLAIAAIIFATFFIRTATWEDFYYNSKEGSERAVAVKNEVSEDEEVSEVEPTETEVYEYTVAADLPRYLTIERLGIHNARVLSIGVNSNGQMGTPNNIFDVGWYNRSSKPGKGGTLVIDGHNGGPNIQGVFKNLPDLAYNDIIQVERGDGAIFYYTVVENSSISLEDADAYMRTALSSPEPGRESLTLISCTGVWSAARGTYLSRQFVRAVLVK